ncbi:FAD-binding oxidoreductase [Nitratidesulfovibrio vulgaris]|jgi:glycolate oxidase|uniref:Glycolate oxidase, subunit GlcD n=2 Tax=Nitratidesulfovibrio vulgaris TaxID=881 RepID=Q726S9_NITV2|nr:FAD-linked oxidase C-terminal domain-containing protein [Nitratidesulfovibrio vulgaris]GEB80275.1 FAD-binding protein [Desulfovibrio desulfuricans]HBW16994.1 FAD-binding oxidoreductase [Desulfovibrio sp.]AAS97498.1 glycolate oxidase, subunit GlcD [Nitratidesulfovibrio vulgaris str. Hildenborough]ABM27369.1 FAD linked oxidase domain protein [Nitratidesulfovibrio vulgaris DP4]ADP87940.1 FAD linked oxidase domain protein [Nitratidesulfovibrio vulgaris RCH1]
MPSASLIKEFEAIIGKENVFTSEPDRQSYAYDSAVLDQVVPALVLRPTETEQLGKLVKLCYENDHPITVRGAGTNLSGGTIPDKREGIVILTNSLNKIIEINEQDLYAVVEPGVVTAKFAAEVAKRGLFYPPDPGSQAVSTLGGNVAENAGGLRGLKYGVTKDYVMGIEFFDVNGGLVKTGSRTVKCVTGYNLAGLMAASEGTLGVFSQITLKLVPPPKASKAMMAVFDDVNKASEAVAAIIAAHVVPCTLEFMDKSSINYVEDFTKAGLPREAAAILLIEVDGHPAQVEDDAATVVKALNASGATEVHVAKDAAEKFKLWEARRNALPALARARATTVLEDATVPRSQIPAMVKAINDIAKKHNIAIGTFGHAGDGNLHPTILCDRRDKHEFERVESAVDEIFDVALSLHGTLSGEHGIGLAKSKWMEKETSKATIEYSRNMKRAIDPKYILNPGKIIGA